MSVKKLIRKSDFERVLITETLPYETPIIFSNDGLYDRLKSLDSLKSFEQKIIKKLITEKSERVTLPYQYKVRKNTSSYRRLSLLHPASQWEIKEFYKKYSGIIIHFCSESLSSMRAPKSVASIYYSKSSRENIYQYKNGDICHEDLNTQTKHTPSFYAYRGHNRLYKFFISPDYLKLEEKFSFQMGIDVSKCFDSIYTHSISWATKYKEFAKANTRTTSFGEDFDKVIRNSNYGETNGIPIGPEISRIFAEVILQKIDLLTIDCLKNTGLTIGVDYDIRRYVDDIYIFSKDQKSIKIVYQIYSDNLLKFNLHINNEKTFIQQRPFISKKSKLVHDASILVNSFFDSFLHEDESHQLIPKKIRSSWKLESNFLSAIKKLCSNNEVDYSEISSFIISAASKRVKLMANIKNDVHREDSYNYFNATITILNTVFFLYNVAPSVSASYKISVIMILLLRFTKEKNSYYQEEVSHKIYELTCNLITNEFQVESSSESLVNLEFINILIASRELGEQYLLPEEIILKMLKLESSLSYFTAMSLLFYTRESMEHQKVHKKLLRYFRKELSNLKETEKHSEKAHLFLDLISCPYISIDIRKTWINSAVKEILGESPLIEPEITEIAESLMSKHWHINWLAVDLLNLLEKKELKRAY
jgi:hypothetical protein